MVSTIVLSGHQAGADAVAARRRRQWSDEDKRRIVAAAQAPSVSVSEVARRHGVNANLVFKWMKDPALAVAADSFVAVEVATDADDTPLAQDIAAPTDRPRLPARLALEERAGIIEIDLACGSRVRVDAHVNDRALARVLRILRAAG
jgi:transposase